MKFITKLMGVLAAGIVVAGVITGCGSDAGKTASADAKTYVVATRGTAKPFSYTDDAGNLTGYDVEILKEVEKRDPSLHFDFKAMSVDAAFVAMDTGHVDLIANQMRHTPARDAKYLYTKEVNNYTVRKLVVHKGAENIQSLEDLRGKTAAVTTNSDFKDIIEDFNAKGGIPVNMTFTDKGGVETMNLVATRRADAAGEYEYVAKVFIEDKGLPLKVVGKTLKVFPSHYLLKKDADHQALADKIDKAIASMRADGTLKQISEKFLGGDYTVKPADAG